MSSLTLTNARVLDLVTGNDHPSARVAMRDGEILEVGPRASVVGEEHDVGGRVVLPGLIDAHVHPMMSSMDIAQVTREPRSLVALRAKRELEATLRRGFTTVRDAAGCDRGMAQAIDEGLIDGPRLRVAGQALSQTGGHGDLRPTSALHTEHSSGLFGRIADGVAEVRRAAREQLREGAHHIKIMASGGVASPFDEVGAVQYSLEEIQAAVDEARAHGTYVMAHAYGPEAISRAVRCGVRSIEHGNLIDDAAAQVLVEEDAFLVPTLITYEMIRRIGAEHGMPQTALDKVGEVLDQGVASLRIADRAGVQVGFGTDLLGPARAHQSEEFRIHSEARDPLAILRSATLVNARLLGLDHRLGRLEPGYAADVIAIDGDPLDDATVLADPGNVALVVKDARIRHSQ